MKGYEGAIGVVHFEPAETLAEFIAQLRHVAVSSARDLPWWDGYRQALDDIADAMPRHAQRLEK